MEHSVTVHITRNDDGSYMVTGSTSTRGGGGLNVRKFMDDFGLRRFVVEDLGVHEEEVGKKIKALRETPPGGRTQAIGNVMLTADEIRKHGLGPV